MVLILVGTPSPVRILVLCRPVQRRELLLGLIEGFVGGPTHQRRGRRLIPRSLVTFHVHFANGLWGIGVVALFDHDVGPDKASGARIHADFGSFLSFHDLLFEFAVGTVLCNPDSVGEGLLYIILVRQIVFHLVDHLCQKHWPVLLLTQGDLLGEDLPEFIRLLCAHHIVLV